MRYQNLLAQRGDLTVHAGVDEKEENSEGEERGSVATPG